MESVDSKSNKDSIDDFLTLFYSVMNVINHKKTRRISLNELELLDKAVEYVSHLIPYGLTMSYTKCCDIINGAKAVISERKVPTIRKELINDIIDDILVITKFPNIQISVPVSDGFGIGMFELKILHQRKIPRITFYATTDPLKYAISDLKCILIEETPYKGYFYSVEKYNSVGFLKMSIGYGDEINRCLLITIAADSDGILLSLDTFEKYFDVIQENQFLFRYIEVYYHKGIDNKEDLLIYDRIKEAGRCFKDNKSSGCL